MRAATATGSTCTPTRIRTAGAASYGNGQPKRLQYLSLRAYDDDFDALAQRFRGGGTCASRIRFPMAAACGRAIPTARRCSSSQAESIARGEVASRHLRLPSRTGKGAAPSRKTASPVRPRHLSHVLLFTPDVPRQLAFYTQTLGLRLSDRSGDIIAFLHGPHASDHHMIAFAKSHAPGLHHSSWDVGSFDDVGLGAELMKAHGYAKGWGVGRHVLGSNYFYYVQDPWGSLAEYSFDIDFVPADVDWPAGDHPAEDSFYIWGPAVPDDFVVNHEQPARA